MSTAPTVDDRPYCGAQHASGFRCLLRQHAREYSHLSVDNREVDQQGRPGLTLRWTDDDPTLRTPGVYRLNTGEIVTRDAIVPRDRPPPSPHLRRAIAPEVAAGVDGTDLASRRMVARQQGYSGEECGECRSLNTRHDGKCLKCFNCGRSSGCS